MRYFGEPRDAPVYEDAERAATPVGRSCLYCDVPIEDGDDGFLIPSVGRSEYGGGIIAIGEEPWHRHCFVYSVLGPLADLDQRPATPRSPSGSPADD